MEPIKSNTLISFSPRKRKKGKRKSRGELASLSLAGMMSWLGSPPDGAGQHNTVVKPLYEIMMKEGLIKITK